MRLAWTSVEAEHRQDYASDGEHAVIALKPGHAPGGYMVIALKPGHPPTTTAGHRQSCIDRLAGREGIGDPQVAFPVLSPSS